MSVSDKRLVVRNSAWSFASDGVESAVGLVLTPFLIHSLGQTSYGMWIVLGSLTSYFGLLDLGIRGSVGRHVAFHLAKGDQVRVNETLSTALSLLNATGLLACAGVAGTALLFCQAFEVPPGQESSVQLALIIIGVNLWLSLAVSTFDAALWGCQRLDLLGMVEILSALCRAGVTVLCINQGGGLVALSCLTLGTTALSGGLKAFLTFYLERGFRVGRKYVTRRTVREIFGYGVWSFLVSITKITRNQLAPILIGGLLGVAFVTPYAVANRLVANLGAVLLALTGAITPFATSLHATADRQRQRRLLIEAGKYCTVIALLLTAGAVFLGHSFTTLWVGPGLLTAFPLLVVLAVGEMLPNTQHVSRAMIFAAAKHRTLAWLGVVELIGVISLTVVLIKLFGILGAAVAAVLPGVYCRGVAPLIIACRLDRCSLGHYGLRVFMPAILCVSVPVITVASVAAWHAPTTWLQFILYGVGFGIFAMMSIAVLLRVDKLRARREQSNARTMGVNVSLALQTDGPILAPISLVQVTSSTEPAQQARDITIRRRV